jgi:hypothetical protein
MFQIKVLNLNDMYILYYVQIILYDETSMI